MRSARTPVARAWLWLLAIFLAAVVVRFVRLGYVGVVETPDASTYRQAARNIAEHGVLSLSDSHPVEPSTRIPPLYPAMLSVVGWPTSTSDTAVVALQCVLDALLPPFLFLVVGSFASREYALAAALVYAVYPGALIATTRILTETFFTVLLVPAVVLAAIGLKTDRLWLTGAGGAAIGLASLCRSSASLLPVALTSAVLLMRHLGPRRWPHAAVVLAGAVLVLAPWAARSSLLAGQFVLVQGASGFNIYIPTRTDLNQANEAAIYEAFRSDPCGIRFGAGVTPRALAEADGYCSSLALDRIRANPAAYFGSRLRTVPLLVVTSFGVGGALTDLSAAGRYTDVAAKVLLIVMFSLAPLLLGLIGAWRGRTDPVVALAAATWIYALAVHAPLWIEPRFWYPFFPFVLITAAAALVPADRA